MITLILRKEEYEFLNPLKVNEALQHLGFTPETHLALREGVLLSAEEWLRDGDVVQLIATISGGNEP